MKIGIIGGTGVYTQDFMEEITVIGVNTPYGNINVTRGVRQGKEIYFLERHGKNHKLIPSKVNYKGNIAALKQLGVDYVIATAAVGGINNCQVGDLMLIDQFIDFTKNRDHTFFSEEGKGVLHVDMTEPYCASIRQALNNAFTKVGASFVAKGTYVCTEGPRFETPAEIAMYKQLGADVVGMTNVPEVVLARESALCYATVALVTNYAAGISKTPLTHKEVSDNMQQMNTTLRSVLISFIDEGKIENVCTCRDALAELNSLK